MSNNNSLIFKDLFDSPLKHNNLHRTHYWIKNFIINICNKNLIMDEIFTGHHQEVIKKIAYSINITSLTQEMYDTGFNSIY